MLDLMFGAGSSAQSSAVDEQAKDAYGLSGEQLAELRRDEARAVALAEQSQLDSALELLNTVVSRAPEYDSALNNRAQVLQLLGRRDDALRDLDTAIALASAANRRTVLKQAYTQRGMLRRVAGDDDGARRDLEQAGELGSALAKREAAKLNPLAQLCNQMVAQVLQPYLQQDAGAGVDEDASSTTVDNNRKLCNEDGTSGERPDDQKRSRQSDQGMDDVADQVGLD